MKVVMLVGHSSGGIGTHVAHLSEQLRAAGDHVVVVGPPDTLGRFDVGPSRTWWPMARTPRALLAAARGLRRVRALAVSADVVHAHGHQAGLVGVLLLAGADRRRRRRRAAGPRLIVSWHNAVLPQPALELGPEPGLERGPERGAGQHAIRRRRGRPISAANHCDGLGAPSARNATMIRHGDRGWRRRVQRAAVRYVVRRADLVTGASSDLVAEAAALGARSPQLAAVPSPMVPELLRLEPLSQTDRARARAGLLAGAGVDAAPDLPLVVTVARVAPQKDLPLLVDAAARLAGACVWVVVGGGDPELARSVREQAASAHAPVHLVGPSENVDGWLQAADVFALTSRWEARALVVQEAMAAGTPVVATDVGGLHDLLADVGTLVPIGDARAVAEAVRVLLTDPRLHAERSARGLAAAARLPDVDDMTREWRARYTDARPMT